MCPRTSLPLRYEFALLGLIRRGPIYGYDLIQKLSLPDSPSKVWQVKIGQIYAYLNKLEEQGYLTSTRQQQSDYPARRFYTITPAGEQAFLEWMRTPVSTVRDLRQLFMLKLFFVDEVAPEVSQKLIADQIERCHKWQNSLENEYAGADGWEKTVGAYRVELVRASLYWLKTLQSNGNSIEGDP